ncbi:spore gernimation protein KB [Virgibacillus soli]|uniref:GerAB/ArcD/ProY family transporter n=1 Tax=Lederbergia galactosidilytica TaxID=217031 RepID=UPI000715FCF4|nr:GerAB/ArcD/ProY family transporter [Lederbergia galactosidilytica]KRG12389.1 spore gernimation protein KB [Virgibacillus soli]MBP1913811.1 spore germination protein KB [Lederbergia galactosidilytica]
MEPAKISSYQLFVLIIMFELGSALLFPIGIKAKQDAWIAILIAMLGGFCIFLLYYGLYRYYPDVLPTTYVQKIIGKVPGRILALFYMLFFLYLAARVLRDLGEMLTMVGYSSTPIVINHFLLIIIVVYTVRKGVEVIARSGELFFAFIYFLAIIGFILIISSDLIHLSNLKPILENGIYPVIKVAAGEVLFFPFGEIFAFSMILPYLNKPQKAKTAGLLAIALSGINLTISMVVNISVLSVSTLERTQFPLLNTIQSIELAEFLERLDIFFMLALIILGFFKIVIYFYAAIIGTADLFNLPEPARLALPYGFIVIFISIVTANNALEHLKEGLFVASLYIHFPFQIVIPSLLLLIAFFKNRKKKKAS